ncbi:hypothetical protein PFISCL1PPCAC_7325, partial [Pristionchus fissidentatus]
MGNEQSFSIPGHYRIVSRCGWYLAAHRNTDEVYLESGSPDEKCSWYIESLGAGKVSIKAYGSPPRYLRGFPSGVVDLAPHVKQCEWWKLKNPSYRVAALENDFGNNLSLRGEGR